MVIILYFSVLKHSIVWLSFLECILVILFRLLVQNLGGLVKFEWHSRIEKISLRGIQSSKNCQRGINEWQKQKQNKQLI